MTNHNIENDRALIASVVLQVLKDYPDVSEAERIAIAIKQTRGTGVEDAVMRYSSRSVARYPTGRSRLRASVRQ